MTAILVAFVAGYTLSMIYVTVFYHRGLAHGAVRLRPAVRRFVLATGGWVTGIDPQAWVAMHRKHHAHSDEPGDPHSPHQVGLLGVFRAQLRAYEGELLRLLVRDRAAVSWCNRRGLWWLPFVLHAVLAMMLGAATSPLTGVAWFVGVTSHPVQGWLVNAVGHSAGSRNFATTDRSRNNWVVAALVFGEGLQNNHHHRPSAACFAVRWYEPDLGYLACWVFARLGVLEIRPG
jgi:stearoyl-CoA desaturase (Delta-9 desaturase)